MIKNHYERKHPMNWKTDKCIICKMLSKTDPLGYDVTSPEIAESPQICTLNNYYVVHQKFIKICISLLALLGSHINGIDEDQFDDDLKDFLLEKYPETELEELKSKTDSVEIKNIIKATGGNETPKFYLKLYAFVYDSMIDFPPSNFIYDSITTNIFFRNVRRLIKVKMHLHHSHTTRKILAYAQDFCNWIVHENKTEFQW